MGKTEVYKARLEKKLGDRWVEWSKGIVRSTIRDAVELVVDLVGETDERVEKLSQRVSDLEERFK